jgi:hypothetical protein
MGCQSSISLWGLRWRMWVLLCSSLWFCWYIMELSMIFFWCCCYHLIGLVGSLLASRYSLVTSWKCMFSSVHFSTTRITHLPIIIIPLSPFKHISLLF